MDNLCFDVEMTFVTYRYKDAIKIYFDNCKFNKVIESIVFYVVNLSTIRSQVLVRGDVAIFLYQKYIYFTAC